MSPRRKKTEKSRTISTDKGVYVVKGAAPKAGTKLTRERITGHLKSLNSLNGRRHSRGC